MQLLESCPDVRTPTSGKTVSLRPISHLCLFFSVSIFTASLPLSQPLLQLSRSCVPSPTADK